MATVRTAVQAKEKVREILKDVPGINGIGVTWDEAGQPCVRVNIDLEIDEASRQKIPRRIDGVPVLVETTSQIRAE